jgi:hypothetical protein
MAKYLVKQKSFVNGSVAEEGAIVDYTPPEGVTVSENLEPYTEKKDPHKGETAQEHSGHDVPPQEDKSKVQTAQKR